MNKNKFTKAETEVLRKRVLNIKTYDERLAHSKATKNLIERGYLIKDKSKVFVNKNKLKEITKTITINLESHLLNKIENNYNAKIVSYNNKYNIIIDGKRIVHEKSNDSIRIVDIMIIYNKIIESMKLSETMTIKNINIVKKVLNDKIKSTE